MLDALTECADLLEAFGGHAHAAGLSVRRENVAELRRRLNEHASRVARVGDDGVPSLEYDLELPAESLSLDLCAELEALEPFGAGWPKPVFVTRNLRVVGEPRVLKERHLKFGVAARRARPRLHLVGRRRTRHCNAPTRREHRTGLLGRGELLERQYAAPIGGGRFERREP